MGLEDTFNLGKRTIVPQARSLSTERPRVAGPEMRHPSSRRRVGSTLRLPTRCLGTASPE